MKEEKVKVKSGVESRLYNRLSKDAHFREQYRFVFSATIIATFFIVPAENALEIFLKWVLGFSMFFAALYLIYTAASIKYHGSRWMYDIFYVSERVRMKVYDIAVDCFAVGLLFFMSLLIVGFGIDILNIDLGELALWITVAGVMLVVGITISLANYRFKIFDTKKNQDTDKLI